MRDARKPEPPKEPDGFSCAKCGRTVYSMKLAPYCLRCRAGIKPAPVIRRG